MSRELHTCMHKVDPQKASITCDMCWPNSGFTSVVKDATHLSTMHSAAQQGRAQHSTAQHSAAQRSTAQHSAAQRSTAQHSAAQRNTAQHLRAQHSTAQTALTSTVPCFNVALTMLSTALASMFAACLEERSFACRAAIAVAAVGLLTSGVLCFL